MSEVESTEATELARRVEQKIDGFAGSLLSETILGTPTTAHIMGGACMGATAQEGVIDDRHRVFGYDGLYVIDGAAISANTGVNPSLTITALAERAWGSSPRQTRSQQGRASPFRVLGTVRGSETGCSWIEEAFGDLTPGGYAAPRPYSRSTLAF